MNYLKIKNWEKYQHYKNRSPVWIKSYTAKLRDFNYCQLTLAERGLLDGLQLLGAISSLTGIIPDSISYIRTQLSLDRCKTDTLEALIASGFVTRISAEEAKQLQGLKPKTDSNVLATNLQNASLEKETEILKRKRKRKSLSHASSKSCKRAPTKDHDAKNLIAHYCELFKAKYNSNPPVNGKSAGIIKRILKDFSLDHSKKLIEAYLSDNRQWFVTRAHDLTTFEQNLNSVQVKLDTGRTITQNVAKTAERRSNNQEVLQALMSKGTQQ